MEGIKVIELEKIGKTYLTDFNYVFHITKHTSPLEEGVIIYSGSFNNLEERFQKLLIAEANKEFDNDKNHKIIFDFINLMRNDKGLYRGWKDNIANAFYDSYCSGTIISDYNIEQREEVLNIANRAADNFLTLLTI